MVRFYSGVFVDVLKYRFQQFVFCLSACLYVDYWISKEPDRFHKEYITKHEVETCSELRSGLVNLGLFFLLKVYLLTHYCKYKLDYY